MCAYIAGLILFAIIAAGALAIAKVVKDMNDDDDDDWPNYGYA
jgi:hypothetical protein